jgi:uncharacterized protein YjiK
MTKLFFIAFACPALLLGCNVKQLLSDPQLPPFPGDAVATFDQQHCAEPSGIVYSARQGTLFVVGDEGDICELLPDGTLLRKAHINKVDLEGITIDPATGILYAIDEHTGTVLEINPDNLEVLRRMPVSNISTRHPPASRRNNRGFEAITFVPDPDHRSGGSFFLANQGGSAEESAAVSEAVELHNTPGTERPLQIIRSFEPGITDLSGLHHDNASELILIISDEHNALLLLTTDGVLRAGYTLPGENQEGITLDASGHLYIAEDSGDIIKYTFPAMLGH